MDINFYYGTEKRAITIPDENVTQVIEPRESPETLAPADAFESALSNPIGTPLEELCSGKKVCFFVEDHTRPEPHADIVKKIAPKLVKASFVRFFITTGSHDPNVPGNQKIVDEIKQSAEKHGLNYEVHINDAKNDSFKDLGTTTFDTKVLANEKALDCDIYVIGAAMVNHYFAGYSNAIKNFLPGCCAHETIEHNHKLAMLEGATFGMHPLHPDPTRRTNPVAEDMMEAMHFIRQGKPAFTLAFIYSHGGILWCESGELEKVTGDGMAKLDELTSFRVEPCKHVVLDCSGHPTDDTLYMAQKGLQQAENAVAPGGNVLAFCKCSGGHSGIAPNESGITYFYELLARPKEEVLQAIESDFKLPMQKPYKLARVIQKAGLWLYTDLSKETIEKIHMHKAEDPQKIIDKWIQEDPAAKILVLKNAGKLAIYPK